MTPTDWKNRIVGEGEQAASQFIANPRNWRTHPQNQRDAMRGALNEVGWVQRVIVNRKTGYLVDGHERVWQALQNGDAPVPYVEVDLDEAEEAYVLATLDPIGAMAQADKDQLDGLLHEVQSGEAGVQQMLADVASDAGLYDGGGASTQPAEIVISPEILERQDYLVFIFDNELDWRAACDEFRVSHVYERDPATVRKGIEGANQGTGHVLFGKALMARLRVADG